MAAFLFFPFLRHSLRSPKFLDTRPGAGWEYESAYPRLLTPLFLCDGIGVCWGVAGLKKVLGKKSNMKKEA